VLLAQRVHLALDVVARGGARGAQVAFELAPVGR